MKCVQDSIWLVTNTIKPRKPDLLGLVHKSKKLLLKTFSINISDDYEDVLCDEAESEVTGMMSHQTDNITDLRKILSNDSSVEVYNHSSKNATDLKINSKVNNTTDNVDAKNETKSEVESEVESEGGDQDSNPDDNLTGTVVTKLGKFV